MSFVAAIDCGTNTIRLMVARAVERSAGTSAGATPSSAGALDTPLTGRLPALEIAENRMIVVRLGQGVDQTGRFAPEALERTFAAIDEYVQVLAGYEVSSLRFAATSATRDAQNREEFISGVKERLGCEVEVISGQEEARLSFLGATAGLPGLADPALVVDIGGGSTEFVLGRAGKPLNAMSMDMGSVRLYERFFAPVFDRALADGKLLPEQRGSMDLTRWQVPGLRNALQQATMEIDSLIAKAQQKVDFSLVKSLVGVAGTVTTVRAQALGLDSYQPERIHASALSAAKEQLACFQLMGMSVPERESLGFMAPGRADVIGTGALIWSRIVDKVNGVLNGLGESLERVVVSESDILNGLIYSQLSQVAPADKEEM